MGCSTSGRESETLALSVLFLCHPSRHGPHPLSGSWLIARSVCSQWGGERGRGGGMLMALRHRAWESLMPHPTHILLALPNRREAGKCVPSAIL